MEFLLFVLSTRTVPLTVVKTQMMTNHAHPDSRQQDAKAPKMSSWDLQEALATVGVKVYLHSCVREGKLCPMREKQRPVSHFSENVDKDQHFWNNMVFRIDQSKVWCKLNVTFPGKQLIPTGE